MSQLQRAISLEGQSQESQEVTAISHPWELHTQPEPHGVRSET